MHVSETDVLRGAEALRRVPRRGRDPRPDPPDRGRGAADRAVDARRAPAASPARRCRKRPASEPETPAAGDRDRDRSRTGGRGGRTRLPRTLPWRILKRATDVRGRPARRRRGGRFCRDAPPGGGDGKAKTHGVSRAEETTTKADLVEEVARAADLTKKAGRGGRRIRLPGNHRLPPCRPERSELRGFGSFKAPAARRHASRETRRRAE